VPESAEAEVLKIYFECDVLSQTLAMQHGGWRRASGQKFKRLSGP